MKFDKSRGLCYIYQGDGVCGKEAWKDGGFPNPTSRFIGALLRPK